MNAPTLFRHYIWLIDTIYRHRSITLEELNEKWQRTSMSNGADMSRTSFNRYRAAIEDMFDITIACNRSTYGYYIDDRRNLADGGIKKWMLETITVGSMVSESKNMKDRILLEDVPSGQRHLTAITGAMQNQNVISITYQKFNEEPKVREVEPYCLKLYHQRWYMLGRRTDKGYLNIFALDRIISVEDVDKKFKVDADFNAREYFEPYFGVMVGIEKPQKVVIRTTPEQANYYRTLPFHSSQRETKTTPQFVEFTLHISPSYDFRQELLAQGPNITVVEPESLRQQIVESLKKNLENYL